MTTQDAGIGSIDTSEAATTPNWLTLAPELTESQVTHLTADEICGRGPDDLMKKARVFALDNQVKRLYFGSSPVGATSVSSAHFDQTEGWSRRFIASGWTVGDDENFTGIRVIGVQYATDRVTRAIEIYQDDEDPNPCGVLATSLRVINSDDARAIAGALLSAAEEVEAAGGFDETYSASPSYRLVALDGLK
jgi:hypothetical protein